MATLPEEDRQKVWRGFMRYLGKIDYPDPIVGMVKQDIKDAVDATDDWINANQASFNTALPETFSTHASPDQKTLMFCAVALMRIDTILLKKVFREVD